MVACFLWGKTEHWFRILVDIQIFSTGKILLEWNFRNFSCHGQGLFRRNCSCSVFIKILTPIKFYFKRHCQFSWNAFEKSSWKSNAIKSRQKFALQSLDDTTEFVRNWSVYGALCAVCGVCVHFHGKCINWKQLIVSQWLAYIFGMKI